MVSGSCDVITGFHVEDWEQHIIVLEGLRAAGIHSLWQQLPHHTTQGQFSPGWGGGGGGGGGGTESGIVCILL